MTEYLRIQTMSARARVVEEKVATEVLQQRIAAREATIAHELGQRARDLIAADAAGTAALFTVERLKAQKEVLTVRLWEAKRALEQALDPRRQSGDGSSSSRSQRAQDEMILFESRIAQCEVEIEAATTRCHEAQARARSLQPHFDAARKRVDPVLSELLRQREELVTLSAYPDTPPLARRSANSAHDEWDDLPAFHGTPLAGRDCKHCGAPVPRGRKNFCSRDCHLFHRHAFGTPTRPKASPES